MMSAEFSEEADSSFESELAVLLRKVSDGRGIPDLRVFLKSVKESMCWCLPIAFEPQEEPFVL